MYDMYKYDRRFFGGNEVPESSGAPRHHPAPHPLIAYRVSYTIRALTPLLLLPSRVRLVSLPVLLLSVGRPFLSVGVDLLVLWFGRGASCISMMSWYVRQLTMWDFACVLQSDGSETITWDSKTKCWVREEWYLRSWRE